MDERKGTFKRVLKKIILAGFVCFTLILFYGFFVYLQTQNITDPKKCFKTSMYQVYLCPSSPNYIRYNQVPKIFYRSLLLSEDASFYSHKGFDWFEIKESFRRNISELRFVRGGSTITQQLAKNLYLTKEKSLERKFKEVFISKQIEKFLTKSQILEKYINVVEFGKNIYGIKMASRHYFDKHPSELNVLEGAYLVSLLPSPVRYSKSFKDKKLNSTNIRRMQVIIRRLYKTNKISDELYVYSKMLIETESWPFPLFSQNDFSSEEKMEVEDELFLELNNTEEPDENENENENENDELIENSEPQEFI